MGLTKQELKKLLKEAMRNGYITPNQIDNALKIFKESGDTSILETIEEVKTARQKEKKIRTIKWYQLSEAEALRILVNQNSTIINDQKTIKGWVTFLGVLALVSVIVTLFFLTKDL